MKAPENENLNSYSYMGLSYIKMKVLTSRIENWTQNMKNGKKKPKKPKKGQNSQIIHFGSKMT